MEFSPQDLARIRHELRTPINHILGYCEMLQEEVGLPASFQEDLGKIHSGGRELQALINEYFDESNLDQRRKDTHQLYHDLRTPVNHIVGYSEILEEEAVGSDLARLLPDLAKIRRAAQTWLAQAESHLFGGGPTPAPWPALEPVLLAPPAPDRPEELDLLGRANHLLVVDDDEANRDLLCRRLQRQGFQVTLAEDGHQALAHLETGTFDLVLLDMVMPGVDGFAVLQRVRQTKSMSDLPVIMVTGRDSSMDVVQSLNLGANDYITKPVDFAVARARIRTHLLLKHAQEELRTKMEQVRRLAADLEVRNDFIRRTFARYVNDDVVSSLLETPQGLELGGEKREVTVVMSDLRGFTGLAERLPPERVVELLNIYLGAMADIVTQYAGVVDEFIGDAVLALFGAPIRSDNHAERAVASALAMQLAMPAVNAQLRHLGIPPLEMGIGINTGEVVVGNIGSARRAKYGVVGSNVNVAGRIQSATVGGEILISEATAAPLRSILSLGRSITVHPKGVQLPVILHEVRGLAGAHNLHLPEDEAALVPLGSELPLSLQRLDDAKQVTGTPFSAAFTHLAARRAILVGPERFDLGTDLKLTLLGRELELPALYLYGKILSPAPAGPGWVVRFTSLPSETARELTYLLKRFSGG